jgi:MoaA/NifB/PqqE/SkfB family radical SAM enzyme
MNRPEEIFLQNKKLNIRELKEKKTVLESRFTSLMCAIENRCNLECIMCGVWCNPWTLPEKTFREIVGALPYLEHAIWLGGEVFLSPYFDELLEESAKYPYLEQRINTNAQLINEYWLSKLMKNNVELICSIDAGTKEAYEEIRKGGSFDQLLRVLGLLREARQTRQDRPFNLRLNAVVMRQNYRELDKLLELAATYGFENMTLLSPVGWTHPANIFEGGPENQKILAELPNTVSRLEEKARQCNIQLFNCLPLERDTAGERPPAEHEGPKEPDVCDLPWQQLTIEPHGYAKFWCWCEESLGNIADMSLLELWNSEQAQAYRRDIGAGKYYRACNQRCVQGEIPLKMRMIHEFEKHFPAAF